MKKIVLAEASPTIKSVADSLLRQNGYDVVCTSDGIQAWDVISKEKPDLVLLGLSLTGLSGLDLCRRVTGENLTGGIPVVLMIGAQDSVKEEDIVSCGARGKLRKPFSPKDLLEVVEKLSSRDIATQAVRREQIPSLPENAKFNTQVASTHHMQPKQESYNLEWLDLSEKKPTNHISKVASFDLSTDDQNLIIDDDQYGLANPYQPDEQDQTTPVRQERDDDYDWFVGEMKKEMEGKSKKEPSAEAPIQGMSLNASSPTSKGDAIKFDDIQPSKQHHRVPAASTGVERHEPGFGDISRSPGISKPGLSTGHVGPGQTGRFPRNISDEEIALIADRVAMKLAALIASRIDRSQIIEAIRTISGPE